MDVHVGGWCLFGNMDGFVVVVWWLVVFLDVFVDRFLLVVWIHGWMFLLGWSWLGGYMDGYVGGCVVVSWIHVWMCLLLGGNYVDTWIDMSLVVWLLGGYMDEWFGNWVVDGWMYAWMCL